jgi:hypothetical protein
MSINSGLAEKTAVFSRFPGFWRESYVKGYYFILTKKRHLQAAQ